MRTSLEQKKASSEALRSSLLNYSTQEVVKKALADLEFGLYTIWHGIAEENLQYRSKKDAEGNIISSHYPSIVAKLLALIGGNLTLAVDLYGRPVRGKETPEQRKEIMKFSEIAELSAVLQQWQNRKEIHKEAEALTETLQQWDETINLLIKAVGPTPEVQNLLLKKQETEKELEKMLYEKKHLQHELICETVDLYYNLIHLMYLDSSNIQLYQAWCEQLNQALGWTTQQAVALTLAKYHTRIYLSGGRNNSEEHDEMARCLEEGNIPFPTNEQLAKLLEVTELMRSEYKCAQHGGGLTSLTRHYEQMEENFPAFRTRQFQLAEEKLIT